MNKERSVRVTNIQNGVIDMVEKRALKEYNVGWPVCMALYYQPKHPRMTTNQEQDEIVEK